MMCDNVYMEILWVIIYAITAYFSFTGQMMPAMYWMSGGMLAEAVVDLICYFLPGHKKCQKK
ncbi:hypothetical protein [Lactobacillus acetotolerans]|uniref:hypothetical protein n=1 Tax=Lactobacillus acetotolerans TaxID=1600 RepID=UPI0007BA59A2|nr:hypothetical protein [Lactobacillus acetotolerans]QGV04419.1 hypothetical protein GJR85_02900 [Lactobacillus acetotolerans]